MKQQMTAKELFKIVEQANLLNGEYGFEKRAIRFYDNDRYLAEFETYADFKKYVNEEITTAKEVINGIWNANREVQPEYMLHTYVDFGNGFDIESDWVLEIV